MKRTTHDVLCVRIGTIQAMSPAYKRILLKLSGEVFCRAHEHGIDHTAVEEVAKRIHEVAKSGVQLVIVVGGGNIWRSRDNKDAGIERTVSDAMGMLATIMNSVALQSSLERQGTTVRVMSAVHVPQLAEPYIRRRAIRHLQKGRVVICAGGTGNPFFTTDSAAALRALELDCNVVLKATDVDGVYDKDPQKFKNATMYKKMSFQEAIEKQVQVMDQAAFSLCMERRLPIRVFNFFLKGTLLAAAKGKDVGTLVQ